MRHLHLAVFSSMCSAVCGLPVSARAACEQPVAPPSVATVAPTLTTGHSAHATTTKRAHLPLTLGAVVSAALGTDFGAAAARSRRAP